MTVLLLPFATVTQGDEPTARLARQLPRMLGREIERACASHDVKAKYLSSRGTTSTGQPGLVATTELPSTTEIENTLSMYGATLGLSGRVGISDTSVLLEARVFSAKSKQEVYAKRFETYPTYYFDAIEEIKLRVVQSLGLELSDSERVELFKRSTESWQAYLYFLLAEDERYAISIGIVPTEPLNAIDLYHESLKVDPDFEECRNALQHYIVLLIENQAVDIALLRSKVESIGDAIPSDFKEAIAEIL